MNESDNAQARIIVEALLSRLSTDYGMEFSDTDAADAISDVVSALLVTREAESRLRRTAVHVCNMFDQADTGHAIEDLGPRGKIARDAIEELKQAVINVGGEVLLPPPTEQYRQFPRR